VNIYTHMSIKIGEKIIEPNPSLTTFLVTLMSCTWCRASEMAKSRLMGISKKSKSQQPLSFRIARKHESRKLNNHIENLLAQG